MHEQIKNGNKNTEILKTKQILELKNAIIELKYSLGSRHLIGRRKN